MPPLLDQIQQRPGHPRQNVLGTYPDVNRYGTDTVGNQYGQFSPFGFNGAYYYTRLNYRWGGM